MLLFRYVVHFRYEYGSWHLSLFSEEVLHQSLEQVSNVIELHMPSAQIHQTWSFNQKYNCVSPAKKGEFVSYDARWPINQRLKPLPRNVAEKEVQSVRLCWFLQTKMQECRLSPRKLRTCMGHHPVRQCAIVPLADSSEQRVK